MAKYIMALDQGTTSSRCIIFDSNSTICGFAQRELRQYYPQTGWVEQDAMEILTTQLAVAQEALQRANVSCTEIIAIGIANQRETVIVWNKISGNPIYNAIGWQCRRTAEFCEELADQGIDAIVREKTGLISDAYFSGPKIKWILDNVPSAREQAARGELLFGTVDTWLIWNLTKGNVHATDYSNASRTMLYNIFDLQWDAELLMILDIPVSMLPKVLPSSFMYGYSDASLFGGCIPITAAIGDQQAALFGQGCFVPGMVKNTYGTGCFLLMNTGNNPILSRHKLLTTVAWGLENSVEYALEGSVFTAGAAIQWLRDELHLIDSAAESEYWARQIADNSGVYFVPAFTGLGAPHWDAFARGAILGLTRGTGKAHIVRAALESIAYQTYDVLQVMQSDTGDLLSVLKADGGACANDFLMQFQADVLQIPVQRPVCIETTALGAAYMAGLAAGYWSGKEDIQANWSEAKTFVPEMDAVYREKLINGWHRAVTNSLRWEAAKPN